MSSAVKSKTFLSHPKFQWTSVTTWCVSDILSGSLSPHTPRDKENEHEAKNKGNRGRLSLVYSVVENTIFQIVFLLEIQLQYQIKVAIKEHDFFKIDNLKKVEVK